MDCSLRKRTAGLRRMGRATNRTTKNYVQVQDKHEFYSPFPYHLKIFLLLNFKECPDIWINDDGQAHLFFRLGMTKVTTKKGEILLCLEYQHCPKCPTSTTVIN